MVKLHLCGLTGTISIRWDQVKKEKGRESWHFVISKEIKLPTLKSEQIKLCSIRELKSERFPKCELDIGHSKFVLYVIQEAAVTTDKPANRKEDTWDFVWQHIWKKDCLKFDMYQEIVFVVVPFLRA